MLKTLAPVKYQRGFSAVEAIIIVLVVAVLGFGAYFVFSQQQKKKEGPGSNSSQTGAADSNVSWQWSGSEWQVSATPPKCEEPLPLQTPVDTTLATAVLYPGQYRGGNYKSHGGFIFRGHKNEDITVKAPMAAKLVKASRYIEQGEVQYFFAFITPCGIMYRFDHLLTLTSKFQAIANTLPPAQVDDSRTTNLSPEPEVTAGEVIATAVGFKGGNVSVDFGVNDLRAPNAVSKNSTWAPKHQNEYDPYGVCWLSLLSGADKTRVQSLPAGDSQSGATSDYCSTSAGTTID